MNLHLWSDTTDPCARACACVRTSVCTMAGLCVLSILTVWKMSTTPSYRILSRTILSVMKTPVLPTPALVTETHADETLLCFKNTLSSGFRGKTLGSEPARTCSAPWSVRPGRTAPLFCALGRWSRWNPLLIWARPARASRWTGTAAPSGTDRPTTQHTFFFTKALIPELFSTRSTKWVYANLSVNPLCLIYTRVKRVSPNRPEFLHFTRFLVNGIELANRALWDVLFRRVIFHHSPVE